MIETLISKIRNVDEEDTFSRLAVEESVDVEGSLFLTGNFDRE